LKTVLGVLLLLPIALAGCRGDVAGGKPVGKDAGMDQRLDTPRPDAICPADAAGGGECAYNFCNQVKVGLPSNQYPQSGADSLCGTRICKVGAELSTGDGFQLVCADPNAGARAFGAACSADAAQGMRCADDSLCITSPDAAGTFCSRLCRNDADCPTTGRCLEYPTPTALADGRRPIIGMCTPLTKIAGTVCVREADCQPGQGCVVYGGRTSLRVCRAGGTKSLGTACGADAECRSKQCVDRDLFVNGGQNRTYCSGFCQVNSDCGPDQTCTRLVVGNNGTSGDPLDDVVVGFCRTLFAPVLGTGCQSDADCVTHQTGDGCDVAHGLCFKKGAVPGSACATEFDCPVGGDCSIGPRFTGGYCQTFGCDAAATSGVNVCPGTNSICAQRGGPDEPISACYEKCTPGDGGTTCSRASAGYTCESARPGEVPSICLVASGT